MNVKEQMLSYLRFETNELPETPIFFTAPMPNIVGADYPLCERCINSDGYDAYGVHWTYVKPASHATPGQKEIVSDIEQWREQLRIPNPDKLDWDYVTEYDKNIDHENNLCSITMSVGPFERSTMLSTFEDCLVNAISEPELYSDMIGALADFRIEMLRRTAERMKIDVVNFHDDWGTTKGPIMNPELWRKTIKPHVKRMYDAAKNLGMIVCQHSCGRLDSIVDDIVEMGASAWEAQVNVNDIDAVLKKHGDRLRVLYNPMHDPNEAVELPMPPVMPKMLTGYDEVPTWLYD